MEGIGTLAAMIAVAVTGAFIVTSINDISPWWSLPIGFMLFVVSAAIAEWSSVNKDGSTK